MLHFFSKKPKWHPSPNFGERKNGSGIEYLILHYTDTKTTDEALKFLMDKKREVSAHYVIDQKGCITHLVKDTHRAWHAGKSYWRGLSDMNSASIGIEIVNPGAVYGYVPFPQKQIDVVAKLCREKIERFNILPQNILAHSDIAPDRKVDPDYLFPWEELAKNGVGLFPKPTEHDYQAAQDIISHEGRFDELLITYGYDPTVTTEQRVTAFHRHFYPEKFKADEDPAAFDVSSIARLLSLLSLQKTT